MTQMTYNIHPDPAGSHAALNCQLQQIASKASSMAYETAKSGIRGCQKAIKIMCEQIDEN
jgi:hypothetical protein